VKKLVVEAQTNEHLSEAYLILIGNKIDKEDETGSNR
jgi:hypothetical protein